MERGESSEIWIGLYNPWHWRAATQSGLLEQPDVSPDFGDRTI